MEMMPKDFINTTGAGPISDAITKFREDFESRSFSGRHPELGKMVNCRVCGLRHRSVQVCRQRISTPVPDTRKGFYGAAAFARKRIRSHHSHRLLRIVEITQSLFPKYYPSQITDPEKAMLAARGEAVKTLVRAEKKERKAVRKRQQESRRVNQHGR